MPQITLNVPSALVPRILAAIGAEDAADAKAYLKRHLRDVVRGYEAEQAAQAARVTADAQAVVDMQELS